jgi:hypothetical protein
MNMYVGIAIGVVIGILIGIYMTRSFTEGFQPTAEAPITSPDSFINEQTLPLACSTIDKLSRGFLNRMRERPEYKSSDGTSRAEIQALIDNHILTVKNQKESLNCPS